MSNVIPSLCLPTLHSQHRAACTKFFVYILQVWFWPAEKCTDSSINILAQSPQALSSKEIVCLQSIKKIIQYIKPKSIYRDHSISSPQNKKLVGKARNRACKVLRYVASLHLERDKRLWIFVELLDTDRPIKSVSIYHTNSLLTIVF